MNWKPTAATIEAFTCGDCWALAIEIHRLTGYPVIFSSSYTLDGTDGTAPFHWDHVGVSLPDERVIDVNGITAFDVWSDKWRTEDTLETSDPVEIADLTDDQTRRYPDANPRALARRLLNHFRIPTTGRRHRDAVPL